MVILIVVVGVGVGCGRGDPATETKDDLRIHHGTLTRRHLLTGAIEAVESIDTHESILGIPRVGIHVSDGTQPLERLGITLAVAEGLGDEAAEFVKSLD